MKHGVEKKRLLLRVKTVFSKRYKREVSDEEAAEIIVNLTDFMEILFKKSYITRI